jgi:Raf kinase inhibitor-like YbhB/YbcL family protein
MVFTLRSPAFGDGQPIPRKYTADGDNVSPPLTWSGAPAGTKSFVLIIEDPDAPSGTFRHWGIYDVTGSRLPEGDSRAPAVTNDFGDERYDGPAPPKGHGVHHYRFRIAALDTDRLEAPSHASVADLWVAAGRHSLVEAELIGTYAR